MNHTDWPNKVFDLMDAQAIIEEIATETDGDAFQRVAIEVDNVARKITIRPPEWMSAVSLFFEKKYGKDEGQEVARKVISACLLQLEHITVH